MTTMSDLRELAVLNNSELEHHGIKGMKWGVRRDLEPSKGVLRRQAKYMNSGMSEKNALEKAQHRAKVAKIVGGVAGAVAISAIAYSAHRYIGKQFTDITLAEGKDLHYVNALGDKMDLNRRLYTTIDSADTKKYKGLLAETLRDNALNTTVYDTVLRTTGEIRAPSQHEAQKLFAEFAKSQGKAATSKSDYRKLNSAMVYFNTTKDQTFMAPKGTKEAQKFMDFLQSKGYNAVLDANDQFISGYDAKHPLIVFNAASSLKKVGQTVVSKAESEKLANQQDQIALGKMFIKQAGMVYGSATATKMVSAKATNRAVDKYFKEHPGTTKSRLEVYRMVTKK